MRFFTLVRNLWRGRPERPAAPKARLQVEQLESRLTPYAATGNLWPHPELVTVSFMPDGTNLGGPTSNLFATFNAAFGSESAWQSQVLKAAQTWAQQTNLNFTVIADNGAGSGTGAYQQGDPAMGDIRIGGFDYQNPNALAMAYLPPPVNNYSIAGDFTFNTGQVFNINGTAYDVYTVALHEFGHTLGLGHSTISSAVMYSAYNGTDYGLHSDDVEGIRSIYSAGAGRSHDAHDAAAPNNSFSTATDLTSAIDPASLTTLIPRADVTTTSDTDFYVVAAPAGGSGQLTVTVQSSGLSLLAPSLRVYNSAQKLVAAASSSGYTGATLTRTISVVAGERYYVRVAGANSSPFGTGTYGLTLNFGSGPSPEVPLPNTQTPNGDPLSGGGGIADSTNPHGRPIWTAAPRGAESGHDDSVEVLTIDPTFRAQARPADGEPGATASVAQAMAAGHLREPAAPAAQARASLPVPSLSGPGTGTTLPSAGHAADTQGVAAGLAETSGEQAPASGEGSDEAHDRGGPGSPSWAEISDIWFASLDWLGDPLVVGRKGL